MKKRYVKPVMESEEFVANEYVATCGVFHCSSMYNYEGIHEVWITSLDSPDDPYACKLLHNYGNDFEPCNASIERSAEEIILYNAWDMKQMEYDGEYGLFEALKNNEGNQEGHPYHIGYSEIYLEDHPNFNVS